MTKTNLEAYEISLLGADGKPALLAHFVALDSEDRRLRFGHAPGDEGLAQYVESLDLTRDSVLAVYDAHRHIIAAAHIAMRGGNAETGLSVLPQARGLGLGTRLFQRAAAFAHEHGAGHIKLRFFSDNQGMQRLALKCGMHISAEAGESEAVLPLTAK